MAALVAPKSREGAALKGRRYLTEGRVVLLRVGPGLVVARVRGDGAVHRCGYEHGAWWCSCPARTDQCAHLVAVRLCTAPDLPS